MKFTLPAPISIDGSVFTFADLVRHLVRNADGYNLDAASARQGLRTLQAVGRNVDGTIDLEVADIRKLSEVAERPGLCGWAHAARRVPSPGGVTLQRIHVPAIEFLPLIDPLLAAALSA